MKPNFSVSNLSWLPPTEEWDFRSVTAGECRVACHWEYARQTGRAAAMNKNGHNYCPSNYRQAARELFPRAWEVLTKEQREKVVASFQPVPVIQVRNLREFFKRMPKQGANQNVLQSLWRHSYVIIPEFRVYGVEVVIREFEKWARKEAKQHPQSRRAQAAELPFDTLKWLAVERLDKARIEAGVTIEKAREGVDAYRKTNNQCDPNDVFPIYASDGAWLKARNNAQVCQTKSAATPSFLLAELI